MMKSIVAGLLATLFIFSAVFAADPDVGENWEFGNYKYCVYDNIEMQIDNNDVVITSSHSRYDDEVRITGNYKLFINDELIETDDGQKKSLKKFHALAIELNDEAKDIGMEGAKIGVKGARIGTKAVAGVMKMLFLNFDEDEFEENMESESDEIEEMAAELEERAEELEEMADNLKDMQDDLSREIREIHELKWF